MQYVEVIYNFTLVACLISLGVGAFLFAVSAAKDAKKNLKTINQNAKNKGQRSQILKKLADYIQFHSDEKKLSNNDNCSIFAAWRLQLVSYMLTKQEKSKIIWSTFLNVFFFISSFFQTRSRFYGRISTGIYDYVFLEFGNDLWCHANDSNGNSLV